MSSTQVAVDWAKSVFEVAVSRRPGKVHESHRLSRSRFQRFFVGLEPVEILMEACGTATRRTVPMRRPCSRRHGTKRSIRSL